MKKCFRILLHLIRGTVFLFGLLFLLFVASQFTNLPWRIYKSLSAVPSPCPDRPTHILVMGGSGIPGESGLSRTFFGARAALLHPDARVLIAMPLGTNESYASRAYLDELRLRGAPPERLHLLDGGRNTREQALRLAEYLAGQPPPHRVLIVTDPNHVRRTAACLRKAADRQGIDLQLDALPVFPLSIEDPLEFVARDLDDPGTPPTATQSAVLDIGSSMRLRYNLWVNLSYTQSALREYSAIFYYRLRGWL